MNNQKVLYKNSENKMICGVCAGLAEYFNMDVSVIRLITVLLAFSVGSGVIAYLVAAVILPEKSAVMGGTQNVDDHNSYNEYNSSDNK
ncbi:PspC domain-containing protein [Ruminococcus sp. NK3A76]|uniref:PspC domain-containing protein n=1 Tax=Ruminococcus sp. NK3A76 TaxID=877411 RepID=UPI000A01BDB1|nr:PspC domain-containing protein [Ruminococcus sp. NK3A76]